MKRTLPTYLNDHLAGARFAFTLLTDLSAQQFDGSLALCATELLPEIEADRQVLERVLQHVYSDGRSIVKETTAWMAEKLGRLKFQLDDAFGLFEAVEMLSLGVLGKRALWEALNVSLGVESESLRIDCGELAARALRQYERLELHRLRLASRALVEAGPSDS